MGQKLKQETWGQAAPSALFPASVFNKALESKMSGSRKCNIKDLLPLQEGEACQGRLLSAGKMEKGKV